MASPKFRRNLKPLKECIGRFMEVIHALLPPLPPVKFISLLRFTRPTACREALYVAQPRGAKPFTRATPVPLSPHPLQPPNPALRPPQKGARAFVRPTRRCLPCRLTPAVQLHHPSPSLAQSRGETHSPTVLMHLPSLISAPDAGVLPKIPHLWGK